MKTIGFSSSLRTALYELRTKSNLNSKKLIIYVANDINIMLHIATSLVVIDFQRHELEEALAQFVLLNDTPSIYRNILTVIYIFQSFRE